MNEDSHVTARIHLDSPNVHHVGDRVILVDLGTVEEVMQLVMAVATAPPGMGAVLKVKEEVSE